VSVLDLTEATEAVIPGQLVKLWQPLLYLVNKLQLTSQLLDSLAAQLSEEGNWCDYLSAGWIARIVTAINSSCQFVFTISGHHHHIFMFFYLSSEK